MGDGGWKVTEKGTSSGGSGSLDLTGFLLRVGQGDPHGGWGVGWSRCWNLVRYGGCSDTRRGELGLN